MITYSKNKKLYACSKNCMRYMHAVQIRNFKSDTYFLRIFYLLFGQVTY